MLYLEWDAFVAVMECWTNVMKADTELRAALVCVIKLSMCFI